MMTLEAYLRRCTDERGASDHVLRARIHADRSVTIFVRPVHMDTRWRSLDLEVVGNRLLPDPDREFAAFDRQHDAELDTPEMDMLESQAKALLRQRHETLVDEFGDTGIPMVHDGRCGQ